MSLTSLFHRVLWPSPTPIPAADRAARPDADASRSGPRAPPPTRAVSAPARQRTPHTARTDRVPCSLVDRVALGPGDVDAAVRHRLAAALRRDVVEAVVADEY